jgi:selenide,water dikinase
VVALDPERALVQTVDFFTPIVDDPYTFGAIAATNAMSDVYAMGGEPLSALNLVAFPDKDLPAEVLGAILQGGLDVIRAAGAVLAGGHSVRDAELKYGLAVTGLVNPAKIWRNGGAMPGDALVLTKSLGTGILTTARKRDAIPEEALADAILGMRTLNRDAKRVGERFAIHACTDITGNGFAGHSWEMARASSAELVFRFADLPLLPGVLEQAALGHCTAGAKSNAKYIGDGLVTDGLDEAARQLVLDPQTSGGLLFAVPGAEGPALVAALREKGVAAVVVGDVREGAARVRFVP